MNCFSYLCHTEVMYTKNLYFDAENHLLLSDLRYLNTPITVRRTRPARPGVEGEKNSCPERL